MTLAGGEGHQFVALEVFGNVAVEFVFVGRGEKVLGDGNAAGKLHVLMDLAAECTFTDWFEPFAQVQITVCFVVGLQVLEAERFCVTEHLGVYDAY